MIRPLQKTLALALLLAPLAAQADRYRVEALVFLNPTPSESGHAPQHPDIPQALALDDSNGLRAAGISLLPDSNSVLSAEWNQLRASKRYQPLLRLAWIQDQPGGGEGPALRLYAPAGDGVSGLDGWLRLSAGRFPHLEADLEYVQTVAGEALAYRLREKRKAPTPALLYLDSARLGVLTRVSRVD
ncbi:MAG: CsiV family protein [Stagnimonas sp.]|nr:CsiV family protein [Stagnimonas sp.]